MLKTLKTLIILSFEDNQRLFFLLLTLFTGNLVTPKTDLGDYVVEPNADLRLEVGEEIKVIHFL